MIKINLLSPDDKIIIKWEKINGFVKANLFLIAFVQILVIICFLITIVYLNIEKESMSSQLESMKLRPEIKESESIRSNIIKNNRQSKVLLSLQKNKIYWTKVFESLSQITVDEVKINSIKISPKKIVNKTGSASKKVKIDPNVFDIEIDGAFIDGDSFREFEESLDKSNIFSGFKSRPGNYDTNKIFKHNLFIEKKFLVEN